MCSEHKWIKAKSKLGRDRFLKKEEITFFTNIFYRKIRLNFIMLWNHELWKDSIIMPQGNNTFFLLYFFIMFHLWGNLGTVCHKYICESRRPYATMVQPNNGYSTMLSTVSTCIKQKCLSHLPLEPLSLTRVDIIPIFVNSHVVHVFLSFQF